MPPAVRRAGVALAALVPSRRAVGLAISAGGFAAALHMLWQHGAWAADPRVDAAWAAGLMAALATALGTLPVLLTRKTSDQMNDGAGVMLAASSFSLIVPALAAAQAQGIARGPAALLVGVGILAGAAALLGLDRWLPHEHFIKGAEGGSPRHQRRLRRAWLFVFAITLHNLPEGLAIGVSYGAGDPVRAGTLAAGIAIQDVPEGLVIAVALLAAGYRRGWAVALGAASGIVEPLAAVAGAALVTASTALLPWGLALAAGAMLFVVSHEIIPETHRRGHERWATCGLLLGFVLMMGLDTALG
jgi:ZIP family zinc transporter